MIKKVWKYIKELFCEEYKFIIILLSITIILNIPLNYYITVGGGISDAAKRIKVDKSSDSKGSFNISYVSQLKGNVLSYGLSYVIPFWERESANDYKYDDNESIEDIQLRSDLDLESANSLSTYWAYTLSGKKIEEISRHLYVVSILPNTNSELKVGDEIVSIDGNKYNTVGEYVKYINLKSINDTVSIKIIRNKKEKDVSVKIFEVEDRKMIGVSLQNIVKYKTDPKVNIKFKKRESGPSGGLITTLEIYNQLTKKDLTKGKVIAGTGTIEEDGTIGPIGGIEHKVLGAAHAKSDVFLAPSGENYKDAKKYIKKKKLKIKLIEVKNIKDAVKKLEGLD